MVKTIKEISFAVRRGVELADDRSKMGFAKADCKCVEYANKKVRKGVL